MESHYGGVTASLAGLTDDVASTSFSAPRVHGVARRRLDVSRPPEVAASAAAARTSSPEAMEAAVVRALTSWRPVVEISGRTFHGLMERTKRDYRVRAGAHRLT